jgi:hypothetical protein
MALYAVHLAYRDTLFCRAIKAVTIGNYLRDVAQFLARFLDVDVRKVDATQACLAPVIQSILDEVTRWEKVPDKREPFTPAMWSQMHLIMRLPVINMRWAHLSAIGSAAAFWGAFALPNGPRTPMPVCRALLFLTTEASQRPFAYPAWNFAWTTTSESPCVRHSHSQQPQSIDPS